MVFNIKPLSLSTPAPVNIAHPGDTPSMPLIREVVRQAFIAEYLTLEAEEQLRQMLKGKYEAADFQAFMELQQAIMKGKVKQEARERIRQRG
jgi:hypothetical protein